MSTAVSLRPERLYLRVGVRSLVATLAALAWASFSLGLSLPWIAELGRTVNVPVALAVVLTTAVVPGFLCFRLAAFLLLERPRRLRLEGPFPAVSLLLAVRNEAERVEETLAHALRQDYPGGLEIIVADDGSTDGTAAHVLERAARDRRVRLLELHHGGKSHALQAALEASTAPLVATVGTETRLLPFALRRAVARLMAAPATTAAVAGAVLASSAGRGAWGDLERGGLLLRDRNASAGPAVFEPSAVALADCPARLRSFGGTHLSAYIDAVYTFTFLPGVLLALTGSMALLGPPAVAVLPLSTLVAAIVFARQRRALGEVGLTAKRHVLSLAAYVLLYPVLLAPLSLAGHLKAFAGGSGSPRTGSLDEGNFGHFSPFSYRIEAAARPMGTMPDQQIGRPARRETATE
jgi:Glycosyl transferase family 2